MIKVYADKDDIRTNSEMPNFVVWSWMRTGLNLSGVHIMLFAYIFSQSFDHEQCMTTSLTRLSEWFGISRQTLSRNIDSLPYVEKFVSQDNVKGFYTYNYYRVNMESLLEYIRGCEPEIYQEFMAAYQGLLLLKFPNDDKVIQDYFTRLINWHQSDNPQALVDLSAVVALGEGIQNNSIDCSNVDFNTLIESIKSGNEWFPYNPYHSVSTSDKSGTTKPEVSPAVQIEPVQKPRRKGAKSPADLGIIAKPPRQKRMTADEKLRQRNENIEKLKLIVSEYVAMNVGNNPECLELLNTYITDVLFYDIKTYNPISPNSFRTLLSELRVFKTLDDKLDAIRSSIGHRYRGFCYEDKGKLKQKYRQMEQGELIQGHIEEFIQKYAKNNESLAELLRCYTEEVFIPTGKSFMQFKLFLKKLEDVNLSSEDMYTVVSETYMNGWKRWSFEFPEHFTSNLLSSEVRKPVNPIVDMTEKEEAIDKFFRDNYLYQNPEIKELLLQYVHETPNGQSMPVKEFINKMNYLILHRFLIIDIVDALKDSVANNHKDFCQPDYAKEKEIKHVFGSLEEYLRQSIRENRRQCEVARRKRPNDPRFEGMPMDREAQNRIRHQQAGLIT